MARARVGSLLTAGVACLVLAGSAAAQSTEGAPPDTGTAFEPRPRSEDVYGVSEPPAHPATADPGGQIRDVVARDGARLYTETYLPSPWNGKPLPSILIYTPYESVTDAAGPAIVLAQTGQLDPESSASAYYASIAPYFARRGYAVTIAHSRGTGRSDGCNDYGGELERDDIARVIEYVGEHAPWASRRVGMYGISGPGTTQIAAATLGTQEHPARTRSLKAIVPMAPLTSTYNLGLSDGVAYTGIGFPVSATAMLLFGTPDSGRATDRASCQTNHAAATTETLLRGDFVPWFAEREYRRRAAHVAVPVLMTVSFHDSIVFPLQPVGFFNYLPADVPHKLVLPQSQHATPDRGSISAWRRADWRAMVTAWYDRWLKGVDTGAERWPEVQVQEATTGQWRTEESWPPEKSPEGRLALGPDGVLGVTKPDGPPTEYSEASVHPNPLKAHDRGTDAEIWQTEPLREPLHLTGAPHLDLWVKLDQPDAHLVANLQAFGPDGSPLLTLAADGRRSARHLDPFVDERFEQAHGRDAQPGVETLIPIRFWPLDVVVPAGGWLRLSLAGVSQVPGAPSHPSASNATVQVLHDCRHTSVFRFDTPTRQSQLINVREPDEPIDEPLPAGRPVATPPGDGGGIGNRTICEKP